MKKILTVVGARPQFIKAATLSVQIKKSGLLEEDILHTGQHYDPEMSKVFFEELAIPTPKYHLEFGGGSHGEQTGAMVAGIERVLIGQKYDSVLVYGDTNSTLAGALAAVKLHIPVAHVEAGLRSFNRKMPEEINRVLTDHAADLLFAPTETAVNNLRNEGLEAKTLLVGDIMYDATLAFGKVAEKKAAKPELKNYYLVTLHRAENVDHPKFLKLVFGAFAALSGESFVLPVHPRLKNNLTKFGIAVPGNVKLCPPASYLEMLSLEKNAKGILTDSGGVQKEAFFQRVPCLTLRTETEWVETVNAGWNHLANFESVDSLAKQIQSLRAPAQAGTVSFFGDGKSAEKMIAALAKK